MSRKTQLTTVQLAEISGKTPKTVQNWANKGKLSYEKDENGKFLFDISEITRVFPKINLSGVISEIESETARKITPELRVTNENSETLKTHIENEFLREKIEDLKVQVSDLKDEKTQAIVERENFLNIIEKQNTQITGLLPAPEKQDIPTKSNVPFWVTIGFAILALVVAFLILATPDLSAKMSQWATFF